MNFNQRVFKSASWNLAASGVRFGFLFLRPVILARYLPVDVFGIYAYANSIINLTVVFAGFGMGGALVHRAIQTENEQEAASVHFTLKLFFTGIWAVVLLGISLLFFQGEKLTIILILIVTTTGIELTQTPKQLIVRHIEQKRLAILNILNTSISATVAIGLAISGYDLWALLATDIIALLIYVLGLYIINPVWVPKLAWSSKIVKYYISFGSKNFIAEGVLSALDKFDDFFTGVFLGDTQLGFYSRAYTFADYPGHMIGMPLTSVIFGAYAEVKDNRNKLSKVFFRTNAFLIRISFLIGGVLVLVAPEFIRIILGNKWLPMLNAFRLMLVFTLLNPIKMTIGYLFVAIGNPGKLALIRVIQLIVMLIGLFSLGLLLGIEGIAIVVDIMLVVGIIILLRSAKEYVQFSIPRLFFTPTIAISIAIIVARFAIELPGVAGSPWRTGSIKTIFFIPIYLGILMFFEREQIKAMVEFFINAVGPLKIRIPFVANNEE